MLYPQLLNPLQDGEDEGEVWEVKTKVRQGALAVGALSVTANSE